MQTAATKLDCAPCGEDVHSSGWRAARAETRASTAEDGPDNQKMAARRWLAGNKETEVRPNGMMDGGDEGMERGREDGVRSRVQGQLDAPKGCEELEPCRDVRQAVN